MVIYKKNLINFSFENNLVNVSRVGVYLDMIRLLESI